MVNKQKVKGVLWERELVNLLQNEIKGSKVKRIAGSGAIGSILNEPLLQGDVVAEFPGFTKKFRLEAKTGYGGAKQLTVKKEWLDKISEEARSSYSIPVLSCKFSGARSGVKYFFVLDFDTFCGIINRVGYLYRLVDEDNEL